MEEVVGLVGWLEIGWKCKWLVEVIEVEVTERANARVKSERNRLVDGLMILTRLLLLLLCVSFVCQVHGIRVGLHGRVNNNNNLVSSVQCVCVQFQSLISISACLFYLFYSKICCN